MKRASRFAITLMLATLGLLHLAMARGENHNNNEGQNEPYTLMNTAQSQIQRGHPDDAQATLSRLQTQYPQYAPGYRAQGELYERQGRQNEAMDAYRQYVNHAQGEIPPDPAVLLKLRQRGLY